MINVQEIIDDPEFGQYFVIFRHDGSWNQGIWVVNAVPLQIECFGPVIAANEKEIVQVPEGDRIHGVMVFYTPRHIPLFTSHADPGTSDEILWGGQMHKIHQVNLYERYGYYKGVATRLKGS